MRKKTSSPDCIGFEWVRFLFGVQVPLMISDYTQMKALHFLDYNNGCFACTHEWPVADQREAWINLAFSRGRWKSDSERLLYTPWTSNWSTKPEFWRISEISAEVCECPKRNRAIGHYLLKELPAPCKAMNVLCIAFQRIQSGSGDVLEKIISGSL